MSLVQENVVDMKISIRKNQKGFLSTLFLAGKRDGGYRSEGTKHIPYQHFKMEDLLYLKFMLQ